MNKYLKPTALALSICGALVASIPTLAEDIDIFVGTSSGGGGQPKVLIVLDNTSNWSRQSQQWPGGEQQGQSEVQAIKQVIQSLPSTVNVGLMEYVTGGNATDNGGFIRHAIKPLNGDNKTAFGNKLTTIYNNVTSPDEKRNSNTPYGNLMYDVYNYFAGANSYSPNGVLATLADSDGYSTTYTRFRSPISSGDTCGKNYIIFIGNPNASGPSSDDAANTAALVALGGSSTQLRLPGVTTTTEVSESFSTLVGNTPQCYANKSTAQAAYGWGLNTSDKLCQLFSAVGTAGATVTDINGTSCQQYSGTGATTATVTDFSAQCALYTQGCTLGTPIDNPTRTEVTEAVTTGYYATAPAATAADAGAKAGLTCPADAISCTYTVAEDQAATGGTPLSNIVTNSCYWTGSGNQPSGYSQWSMATNDFGNATCDTTKYSCSYVQTSMVDANVCSTSRTKKALLDQVLTAKKKYKVIQTATLPGGTCPAGTNQYKVLGSTTVYRNVLTTSTVPDTGPRNADEWSDLLYRNGVPVSGSQIRSNVATYTIDVYNKQPNATQTALLMNMAKVGGGKYFAAKNKDAIVDALNKIMVEIQAINSTFASTSLPVNATNRTQNENQVFIGMFRPDRSAKPRWFGNLKRYQLVNNGGNIELGDKNGDVAVNTNTGFLAECATSFWTTDSSDYWRNVTDGIGTSPALLDPETTQGKCPNSLMYSDAPDGPLVEKGAVAQVLRKRTTDRNVYTVTGTTQSGDSLSSFNTTTSGLTDSLVNFISGKDVNNEKSDGDATTPRPSIHGDVIHSRPLPINYGSNGGIVVYYGANDGTFRAVSSETGEEKWAFIAPEFFPRLSRLMTDSPLVSFRPTPVSGSTLKDYFFDGSTGFYQSGDNSKVWLFPTMRRGGRMIYALDVHDPNTPTFKWKAGCPNLADDTDCTTGMSGIGQTWSTPRGARIKGNSTTAPVLIVGGGYDACEDENAASPTCGSTKGNVVYVLDANTGAKIKAFSTTRSVASDIAMVDIDGDGYVDYAYAADTGGNIYRMDFIDSPSTRNALASTAWTSRRVAHTAGGRKFLFAPAVFPNNGKVYLAIGSGDREHPLSSDYPYANVVNRFFVFKDDLASTSDDTNLDDETVMANYTSNTTCSTAPILPSSSLKGWFMNLNQNSKVGTDGTVIDSGQGEQTVTSALIVSGMVTFSTNRPLTSTASCSTPLGEARGYWVNLLNASGAIGVDGLCGGERSSTFVGGGLPPSPVLATGVPINNKPTTVVIGAAKRRTSGATGASVVIDAQEAKPAITSKRRRIYSYTKGEN